MPIDLGRVVGFAVVRELELIEASPAVGFLAKSKIAADAVDAPLDGRRIRREK